MTKTPFDDPIAYDRRWVKANSEAKAALTASEPLLFLADHISTYDRREGCVALALIPHDGQPTLAVVPVAPAQPSDLECLAFLGNSIETIPGGVHTLGIVHHRRGSRGICDVDRRWALALTAVCTAFDIEPLGVMARLHSGELVRVPLPDVLPEDYLEAMDE